MAEFDVIIIGSGIGGLVSAGILTSKGLKTLLIERHATPGGYVSSFKRKGFIFDSAVDCISGVEPGGVICNTLGLLNVEREINFIRVDPIRVSIFPEMEVAVDASVDAYIERLVTLFPSEAASIKNFFQKISRDYDEVKSYMDSVVSGSPALGSITENVLKLMNSSYEELLSEYFSDYKLRAVLSDRCPFIGLSPSKVSALAMVNLVMSYFRLGAYRPAGGFQRLADKLVEGIKKKGGRVIFGQGVKKILLDHGSCCGVICDGEAEYTARHIVSNADFHQTFVRMLGGAYASFAKDRVQASGISTSFFMVYAGITGEACKYSSTGYFHSYEIEKFFAPETAFCDDTTIGITVASVEDKTRAPEGCSTVVLHEMTEASDKILDKSSCAEKLVNKAERLIPDFKNRITVLDSAAPKTLERYTGNFNGAAFGWRQMPGFRGVKQHGIKNLYIAGHWGDMGSGVLAAAYSGATAAAEILAQEGIRFGL